MKGDISEIFDADVEINNAAFSLNDRVVPPVPTLCRKGDKPYSRIFYIKKGTIMFSDS